MDIPDLHPWNLDYQSARSLQTELRNRLDLTYRPIELKIIAGCDVSSEWRGRRFYSAVVVQSFPDFEIIEEAAAESEAGFPYIPGLLSFREMPALLQAWRMIETRPDLIFCDGSGTIHPRGFGLACHLGLWLGIPTIGSAKNLLCGQRQPVGNQRGDWEPISVEGAVAGAAVRTREGVKPVYVSPGNLISLQQAVDFTIAASPRYRIPEPIRAAHQAANRVRTTSKTQRCIYI